MFPTILAITASYYLFEWLLSPSLQNTLFDNFFNPLAMLPAGIIGGLQFAATTGRGLRWPKRLLLSLYSNIAIIIAPTAVTLFFAVPMMLLGFGFAGLAIMPALLTLTSVSAAFAFLITFALAIPIFFIGLSIGQWIQYRWMSR